MEEKFVSCAIENFKSGYSCSESIARAAVICGYADENIINIATSFSGGMRSGCLCGALAGAQIVIGYLFGKNKTNTARELGHEALEEFKKTHNATCCRILTKGFDFHSPERKAHCFNMVESAAKIAIKIIESQMANSTKIS